MADNETIDDIIAEMRKDANDDDYTPDGILGQSLNCFADRLYAAHKREIEELEKQLPNPDPNWEEICAKCSNGEVEPRCEYYGEPRGCNSPIYQHYPKKQVGNAAKLRETVKHIKDRLPYMLQYMRVHWEDASAGGYFDELMLVIDAALSTPPRNCDLPEVAKDPWRAWLDDKSNWDEFGSPKLEIHDWLLAPATEKEGGAK